MSNKTQLTRIGTPQVLGHGPVRLRVSKSDKDTLYLELGVDYERAEVPQRFYYADYCNVLQGRVGLSFIFGKLVPGTSELRTKVEITFPEQLFVRQLWQSSRHLHETTRKLVGDRLLPPVDTVTDTDKVQSFRSNNVFMAVLGDEAVMDFYYISPGDIHFVSAQKRTDVNLDPVIRVVLATAVLFEFLEKCASFAEKLKDLVEIDHD
jgi:hypothetical protein